MNYSEQTTYGRKVVKGGYKKKSEYYKRLYISWGVCILIGLVIGILVFWGISSLVSKASEPESYEPNVTYTESPSYGTVDDRIFNSEISMDWDSGASLGFVPLDVPMDEEMQEFIYCLSYICGVDGISFEKPASITASASNADLANGANWAIINDGEKAIPHKAIAIAKIVSKG